MRARHAPWMQVGCTVLLGLATAACGDEPAQTVRPQAAAAAAAAAAPSAAAAKGGDLSKLEIPEKLKLVDWNAKDDLDRDLRDTRDPFQIYLDDIRPKADATAIKPGENPCSGSLCEEEAGGLELIAIITGTAIHKAMMVDSRGTGHMVRAGDVVGRFPFRITRITRNEVVMKPLQPPVTGQPPPQEVVKRLVSQEELQELLP